MSFAGRLWSAAMLMTSLVAMTSCRRDVTEEEELRIAVIVPYDERRLFSLRKVLLAVHDALRTHDVTHRLVLDHREIIYSLVLGYKDVTDMLD